MSVASEGEATVFLGKNAFGNDMIGDITGDYEDADLDDLTPNGKCKENGCDDGDDGLAGGRPNNLPICPITSSNNLTYVTLAGGGLLVADFTTTPMSIVGEYGQAVVYGAGCGGAQSGDQMFINAGVSASPAGADQSMFAVFSFDDTKYESSQPENFPMPVRVFQDAGNTKTGGNVEGIKIVDSTGQLPAVTTRRDSHGAAANINGEYVYIVDR